ncbi:2-oxoglutarate and iron-dependent oxygenase domain-containing protein [Streptomyces sp. NPDC045470]|uniref:isopenicillin N synthase family dioxygenase n=1 Tax=Streptomyces sp. NPDC045470 TaxID=3155469 RepID=UPI0033D157CE
MHRPDICVIDLSWWSEGRESRERLASAVDRSLRASGFLLVRGHGLDPQLPVRLRAAARAFFALPAEVKARYAQQDRRGGWFGRGQVSTAASEGTVTPPDLKESWAAAFETRTARTELLPARWPAHVPLLRPYVTEFADHMRALSDTLLQIMATALGQPEDFFTRHTTRPNGNVLINWYPPRHTTGPARPGQFRIGAHTDFGLLTLLDRQNGQGGLQVHDDATGWQDAPWQPGTLTLNIGDLMQRWSGDRWHSGRHRVLPPPPEAPAEELTSLVYFHTCAPDIRITSLPAVTGHRPYETVLAGDWLHDKLRTISP